MSKICSKCGGVLEDTTTFCQYCGEPQNNVNNYAQPQQTTNQQYYAPVQPVDDHTGIGGWIGWIMLSYLLGLIGMIITICCTKDKSVKNWVIANIILTAVVVLIVVVLLVVFGISLSSLAGESSTYYY